MTHMKKTTSIDIMWCDRAGIQSENVGQRCGQRVDHALCVYGILHASWIRVPGGRKCSFEECECQSVEELYERLREFHWLVSTSELSGTKNNNCRFMMGYGVAYGDKVNKLRNLFVGNSNFLLLDDEENFAKFTFQGSLAAAAGAIVAGSVAERTNLSAFFCYNWVMSTIIFPVVVHMCWSTGGWLSASNVDLFRFGSVGFIDFAGAGVIHMTGGVCGFCGAFMVGPRLNRFKDLKKKFEGHDKTLMILGGLIMWFGWYAFNAGHTMQLSGNTSKISTIATVNLTLAASMGAITSLLLGLLQKGQYDLTEALNGTLAGCVAISGVSGLVSPWLSLFIGTAATLVYKMSVRFLVWIRVDDPLEAFPIHACCGFLGTLCVGLFARKDLLELYVGREVKTWGLFMGGGWELFYTQLVGIGVIVLWVSSCATLMFQLIDLVVGLRVAVEDEEVGLDLRHGGQAYSASGANPDALANLMQKFSSNDRTSSQAQTAKTSVPSSHRNGALSARGMPPKNRFPSMPSLEYTRKTSYKDLALDISVISPRSPTSTPRSEVGTVNQEQLHQTLASQLVDYI